MAELPGLPPVPDMTPATTAASTPAPPTPVPSPAPGSSDHKKEKTPDGYAPPCRRRPATSKYLDKRFFEINGMHFPTVGAAMAVMSAAQWRAPPNDVSIPVTQEQHRHVAMLLTDAFKDMSMAKDTADNAYRKRLTPGKKEFYGDWAIENCAWHIIYLVKDIHINGFKTPIYDRALVDSIGQTRLWTFRERILWICLVLRTSKSVVATLMKHEKVWTTIGAPHKLYNSTIVNTESNANRNRWVKDGRARDQAHATPRKAKNTESKKRRRTDDDSTTVPKLENDAPPAPMSVLVTDTNMNAAPAPAKKQKMCTRLPRNALGMPVLSQELADMSLEEILRARGNVPLPPHIRPRLSAADQVIVDNFARRTSIQAILNPAPADEKRPVRRGSVVAAAAADVPVVRKESVAADASKADRAEPVSRDAEEMDVAMTLMGMGGKRGA